MIEKLVKLIRDRKRSLEEVLLEGHISDYTDFKVVRARVNELALLEQDLKDLLKRTLDDTTDS